MYKHKNERKENEVERRMKAVQGGD